MLLTALLLAATSQRRDRDDDDRERARPAGVHQASPPAQKTAPSADHDDDDAGDKPNAGPTRSATPSEQAPGTTSAQRADGDDAEEDEGLAQPQTEVVVTARRLDAARTLVDVGLGATVSSLSNDAVEDRPGGETGSIATILQQVPGALLSGHTLVVRGSAANQVRINNVIVPEAIADPADLLSSRLAQTTRLITGTLPAQFGFAPGGVISITTKNGLYQRGGQAELFAGSDGMFEPAVEWAGSAGPSSLFASGSLERRRTRVADATGAQTDDRGLAFEGLGFADHVIDDENRVSVIVGGSHERHRFGTSSAGAGEQRLGSAFGVATLQQSTDDFTLQASLFGGLGDDQAAFLRASAERRDSWGSQIDGSAKVGAAHLLRFGLLATRTTVRQTEATGKRRNARSTLGLYAQDEWTLGDRLTLNPGVRLELPAGIQRRAAVEPRASLVWAPVAGLTAHVGYARYAAAPPLDERNVLPPLRRETDDLIDGGVSRTWGPLTLTADAYWRDARGLLVERRVIGSALPDTFQFSSGRLRGLEISGSYGSRGTTAWASLSISKAEGKQITGGGSIFSPRYAQRRRLGTCRSAPIDRSGWRVASLDGSGTSAPALMLCSRAVRCGPYHRATQTARAGPFLPRSDWLGFIT